MEHTQLIEISTHEPIVLTEEQKKHQIHATLVELLNDELEEGCGIGAVLVIMDDSKSGTENQEWYISSKIVLANVGIDKWVKRFEEKYPKKNSKTS